MANTVIDAGKFKDDKRIISITFGEKCQGIGNDAFYGCDSLEEIDAKNISEIGSNAFAKCSKLGYINLPICNTIDEGSFSECTSLKKIEFSNVQDIKKNTFKGCTSLNDISLKNINTIGDNAFENCSELISINLPICSKIGSDAFKNCVNLSNVFIKSSDIFCELGNKNVFFTNDNSVISGIKFHINAGMLQRYMEDTNWEPYIEHMITSFSDKQIMYISNINDKIEIGSNINVKNNEYIPNKYGLISFEDDITSIPNSLFYNSAELEEVFIPSTCNRIEESAFERCINLINITLTDSLQYIDNFAFKGCSELTTFNIPKNIVEIGEGVFAGCVNIEFVGDDKYVKYDKRAIVCNNTLIYVSPKDNSNTEGRIHDISKIDTGINRLGQFCFSDCKNMRRVNIPEKIKSIGDGAFENCENLCEVYFYGTTPPTIGLNVFSNVRSDFKIFVPESSLMDYYNKWLDLNMDDLVSHIYPMPSDNSIIYYSSSQINNNYIEQSYIENETFVNGQYYKITNIKNGSVENYFTDNVDVTKVILSENITKINNSAFKGCKNLEYIYLPDTIVHLFNDCFYGCESLTRIHIPIGLNKGMFNMKGDNIGRNIFYGCSKLKEFGTYYKGYVSDDNRCYMYDKNLMFFAQGDLMEKEKDYEVPNNITAINATAFKGSEISSIKLNSSITKIEDSVFNGCTNLKTITDWNGVTDISNGAFGGCVNLQEISLPQNLQTIGYSAFENCTKMCLDSNIPESVSKIESCAFKNCTVFKINKDNGDNPLYFKNVEVIGTEAFYGCAELKSISLNNNITKTVSDSAFKNCTGLTSVDWGDKLQYINKSAFQGCTNLTQISLPRLLKTIDESAFEGCTTLANVYNNGNFLALQNINKSAFKGCTSLREVDMPKGVINIGNSAFEGCTKLTNVNIIDAAYLQTIGSRAFYGCTKLWNGQNYNLTFPNSLETIESESFYNCGQLSSITLPTNLKKLGKHCFARRDLNDTFLSISNIIYIPNTLTTPPSFTSYIAEPFGSPFNTSLRLIVSSQSYLTYYENSYWNIYKDRLESSNLAKMLESFFWFVELKQNGETHITFRNPIPYEWVDSSGTPTIVLFKFYDANKSELSLIGKFELDATLTDSKQLPKDIIISNTPYGTQYIKITGVNKPYINYTVDKYINVNQQFNSDVI